MSRLSRWRLLVALLPFCSGTTAFAADLGIQATYAQKTRFGMGARAAWGRPQGLGLAASLEYFPYDDAIRDGWGVDARYFEANGNLTYTFSDKRLAPYLGIGLNLARVSVGTNSFSRSDTRAGLNVLTGLRLSTRRQAVFIEARLSPTSSPRIQNAESVQGMFTTRVVPRQQFALTLGTMF